MAISKIKPRHASEGRSIAAVLKDRIDYDKNPDKTKGGLLVSSYQCDPDTAWQEFALSKQIYEKPLCFFISELWHIILGVWIIGIEITTKFFQLHYFVIFRPYY